MKKAIDIAKFKNKTVIAISIFIAIILISFGVIYANNFASKGELNGDGQINYADVSLLELHLIHLQELPEDKLENADMNSDGQITVTDLTLLIQKIEKTLEYEVTIRDLEVSNYYPNKNEEITFSFNADVSYGEELKSITINGNEFEVTKNELNSNKYEVTKNVGETSGLKEYKFEKVTLANEKEIKINNLITIEVLKTMPTIENWIVEDDLEKTELNISFNLEDKDGAFQSGSYRIIEEKSEEEQNTEESGEYIKTGNVSVGENHINVKVDANKKYKIVLCIQYDLATGGIEQEGQTNGVETIEEELGFVSDYEFELSNIKTYEHIEDTQESEVFNMGNGIIVKFDSTNKSEYIPKTVTINGKTYELEGENNTYVAYIDGFNTIGEQNINIEKVILNNGRAFDVNQAKKVKAIKNLPIVLSCRGNENKQDNNIQTHIYIKDINKSITNLTAKVFDEKDNIISSKDLTQNLIDENIVKETENKDLENSYYINTTLDTNTQVITNTYKIKIFATYDLSENDENYVHTDEMLLETIIDVAPVVHIQNVEVSKKYPEKNENVTLTYEIERNREDLEITHIMVNNLKCIATKHIDNDENVTYSVTLNVGETAGVLNLKTTEFSFEENFSCGANYNVVVDILKDKPTTEAFSQVDDIENKSVTLTANIVDPDGAVISGLAELVRNDNGELVSSVNFDKKNITFEINNLELNTQYTLVAKMTYDRDTNTIEEETDKNYVEDEIFRRRPIQLIADYELQISNIETYNGEKETEYFERGQEVTVSFDSINQTEFYPVYAIINGTQYELQKVNQNYKTNIPVVSTFGPKTITIEKIILNNTKEIELTENNKTQVGILKLRPTITDFGYSENADNGNIDVSFKVNDTEDTITDGTIKVINEDGVTIKEERLTHTSNGISFEKGVCEEFEIQIFADYDLDTNQITTGDNEYENQQLLKEGINISAERLIELKDIITINLYSKEDPTAEVSSITEEELSNLENYIVKVIQKEMPIFYAEIESYEITEDGNLDFILDYDNVIQYENGKKQNKLKVMYGKVNNGVAENKSIETLIAEIEANPDGDFTLTQDYDVSYLKTTNNSLITGEFRGTLNGNGHKIYNLSKPLFNTLESATIQNIQLEKVNLMEATSRGSIANIATNTTVKNVHVKNLNVVTKANESGGIVGNLIAGTVEECSVTNYNVTTSGHIRIGGIVGYMNGGTIKNCYVQGEVNSTQSKDGNGIGGILGHGTPTTLTIENCITKINYVWTGGGRRFNGGIIGLTENSTAVLKNNVSLSTGTGIYKVCGISINRSSTNNYELEESELTSNATGEIVKTIAKNNITKEFFKDSANFDESIWNLEGASYDNIPTLKGNRQQENETETNTEEIDANLYIPEYDRIKNTPGFNTNKLIAYNNIQKLMPYYDAKYVVLDSVSISNTDTLNTKAIKHILPYADNKLVTYLTSKAYNGITSIKVIFTDYTVEQYEVNFEKLMGNIAIYKIPELNLSYAFGNYIINEDSEVIKKLADYIKSLDYNTVLEPLTAVADSRLYRDNYNNVIKNMAEEIALQILQNDESSILMLNNEVLNKKIEKELIGTEKINKMIYAYNYYRRWYGFEISGTRVSDILLFEGKMYSDAMTLYNVVNEVLVGNLNPGGTDRFYTSCLKKYTGSSTIGYFLDYIIAKIGGYENVDDWFTEYFGARNILAEVAVDNQPEILYRGWYQLKKNARMVLPVITLPNDCAYMISGPAHLQFGPSQLYHKDPQTDAGRTEVKNKVNNHVKLVKSHFSTLADSFDYGKWNNYCIMVYDCTKIITGYKNTYFPGTNIVISTGPVYTQGKVGLEYPFFKNFSEVLGLWQPGGSSAGVGNTAGFLWFQARPGLTNFDTWTHEFEHALYDKIMLYQRGARVQLETLTEGNVQQYLNWSENNLNQDVGPYYFNTSFYLNKEGNATQNLTPERINTKEKLENYYKGQQNALDLLDYIEGKAFIRLTPEQQARIATRMNISAGWSSWGGITAQQATNMNLTSLEALYDNRIMLRPNNAWGVSVRGLSVINGIGSNDYGFESVWVNRWFIGHLDGGYADAFSTKRNFFEMLGYAGVEGYVTYGSRASANDLDAIKKITKMVTGTEMDWKQYKMSRYDTVEENIENNKYIDVQYMIDRFTEALTNDANNGDRNITQRTNLRKIYYHYLKSATNDFIDDPLGTTVEVNHIKTAQELVEKINAKPYGYYVLDNDIDFSEMTTNVTQTFMGRLDGNGHKIIGNKIPIFNKIRYGYVGNLTLENTDIPRTNTTSGALANKIESSTAEKINAIGLKMFFGSRNDLSLIGGAVSNVITRDCTVERLITKISNKEEFISKINAEKGGLFELTNNIDFTGYADTSNAVITGTFTGKINGKGYTISNLNNNALFEQFNGTVEDLNISNFNNASTGDFVAAFAKQTFTATFKNMKFDNITLSGRNNVAVVSGMDGRDNANSIFENISVKNSNVTGTGVYVSNFVGRKFGGKIKNVYVQGTLTVSTTENGGIVGAIHQAIQIENVVSNVDIKRPTSTDARNANGGFIGNIYNTPSIKNSISIGNMTGLTSNGTVNSHKFTAATEAIITSSLVNCYELSSATGISSVTQNTQNSLKEATDENVRDRNFYINTLNFDENIWNLDNVATNGYPELK